MKLLIYITLLTGLALNTACTKERPYKSLTKFNEKSKIKYDENRDYMYSVSVVDNDRRTTASRAYWMGESKIVRFKFTEGSLDIIQPEEDLRFQDNPTNYKTVLSIPAEYKSYRCRQDTFGECTNVEEENNDLKWFEKDVVELDYADTKIQEVNYLPIQLSNLFSGCYNETGKELLEYEPGSKSFVNEEDGVLNFKIKKTFKASGMCLANITRLEDVSFSVIYHYSMVAMDKLVSNDYQKMEDQTAAGVEFGFFKTEKLTSGADNNTTVDDESRVINRWNPNRKEIVYYLDARFEKPQNKSIREASYHSINVINKSLKEAKSPLKIVLKPATTKIQSGDLRYNMINLVEDPVATGLLGYGPSVANPKNGEIVHARTVMYIGTIIRYVKRTFDELIELKIAENKAKSEEAQKAKDQLKKNKTPETISVDSNSEEATSILIGQNQAVQKLLLEGASKLKLESPSKFTDKFSGSVPHSKLAHIKSDALKKSLSDNKFTEVSSAMSHRLEVFSQHNAFSGEMFNFNSVLDKAVEDLVKKIGLKKWVELNKDEQKMALDVLTPYVYIPTLIHEVGHNLGLRHNFNGSEDKENFYSEYEVRNLLGQDMTTLPQEEIDKYIHTPSRFKYSSIMDYSYQTTNELNIMGKYDIAALKFAYAEKVDLLPRITKADGTEVVTGDPIEVSIKKDQEFMGQKGEKIMLSEMEVKLRAMHSAEDGEPDAAKGTKFKVKPYKFCTDEHVSANPTCNRFDEGTNLVEITQHYIDSYKHAYKSRNFRNKRYNYSSYSEYSYLARLNSTFRNQRMVFELIERIKNQYDLPMNHSIWNSNEFLKELRAAANLSVQFFVDIVRTPNVHCLMAKESNPIEIVDIRPLSKITTSAISCFDKENVFAQTTNDAAQEKLIPVGQAGKFFTSKKDPRSTNAYMDQIDVRGIYIDKIMALKFLFNGKMAGHLFDKNHTENYLMLPEAVSPMLSLLQDVVTGSTTGPMEFNTIFGVKLNINYSYKISDDHNIETPLSFATKMYLGLPFNESTNFQRVALATVKKGLESVQRNELNEQLSNILNVKEELPNNATASDYMTYTIASKDKTLYAKSSNVIAQTLMKQIPEVSTIKAYFSNLPDDITTREQYLKWLDARKARFAEILSERTTETPDQAKPGPQTEEEKALFAVDVTLMALEVNEALNDVNYFETTLDTVSTTSSGSDNILADLLSAFSKEALNLDF